MRARPLPTGEGTSSGGPHPEVKAASHLRAVMVTLMETAMTQVNIGRYLRHGTLPQLRLFEASVRLGSLARAAEELHMAPPTATAQIRKLTETVGLPLLEQVGKRMYPTDVGRCVYDGCNDVFRALGSLEEALDDLRGLQVGGLRIAAASAARYFAPRLLGAFAQLHPGVRTSLHVDNCEAVMKRLRRNEDDVYLLADPPAANLVVQALVPNDQDRGRRIGEQVDIVFVAAKSLHHRLAVVDVQRCPDARMKLRERAEQPRREIPRRRGCRDAQPAHLQAPQVVERLFQRAERAEHVVAAVIDAAPHIGRVHALAHLLQQRQSDGFGEFPDLRRGGGRRHVQFLGGARQASEPHARLEQAQLRERAVPEVASYVHLCHGGSNAYHDRSTNAKRPSPRDEGRRNWYLHPFRQRSCSQVLGCTAVATGARARVDDRRVAARRLPELLPFGGMSGYSRTAAL